VVNSRYLTVGGNGRWGTQVLCPLATGEPVPRSWNDSLANLQPMQLTQHKCDVVTPSSTGDQACSCILNRLQSTARCAVAHRWCRTAVSCSSPGGPRWTPGPASWWHARITSGPLVKARAADCSRINVWVQHKRKCELTSIHDNILSSVSEKCGRSWILLTTILKPYLFCSNLEFSETE